ncbi:MAG: glycosyltransferase family 2 protein [Chloroflexota bacterium]
MKPIKISIIIVSWNTKGLLADCLDSLISLSNNLEIQGQGMQTVVVDNNSSDGTVEMLQEAYPWVELLDKKENLGFPAGNNVGFEQGKGEYLLMLNPDTIVHDNAIEKLIAYLDSHPNVGAVGARLLNPDGSLQESCYPKPTLGREFWRLFHMDKLLPHGVYDMNDWSTSEPREVDVIMGACILTRNSIMNTVGGLDEEFFMYSEEVDLCYRMQGSGWEIHWHPEALVTHLGGQSTKLVKTEMFLRLYESKLLYFNKNHGRKAAKLYKIILFLSSLPRLVLIPLSWFSKSHNRRVSMKSLASQYWQLIQRLPQM